MPKKLIVPLKWNTWNLKSQRNGKFKLLHRNPKRKQCCVTAVSSFIVYYNLCASHQHKRLIFPRDENRFILSINILRTIARNKNLPYSSIFRQIILIEEFISSYENAIQIFIKFIICITIKHIYMIPILFATSNAS